MSHPPPTHRQPKLRLTRQRQRPRPSYRAARAFYLTLAIGACWATYAFLLQPDQAQHASSNLHRRQELGALHQHPTSADSECRLVHRAHDQCAFIHTHCAEDEPGFAFYLHTFYCTLPHAKPFGFLLLVAWLGLLFSTIGIAASDFFCINLSTIAAILGMSESMAGVTLLAFGNGSPDVFSTFAAMSTDSGSLAVGELFGAAGFITAVVAGSMALIRPFHVARKSFVRDVGFFVVAAGFSMVFLWDGRLHLWECVSMVVYYILYVAFVVAWHWWIGRRRRRREKEAAARGHYLPPGDELDAEGEGEYRDDPGDAEEAARPSMVRGMSVEDWGALEGGNSTPYADGPADEDDEEEARDRWMSELNSNMRLTRPGVRSRKNTISSVRPSLVGALEFQAVLKSLQKSRNIQTIPLHARRYSDDPSFTTAQQQDHMSSISDPASRPAFQVTVDGDTGSPAVERPPPSSLLNLPKSAPARNRAVSANDAAGLRIDQDYFGRLTQQPSREDLIDVSDFGAPKRSTSSLLDVPGSAHSSQQHSPTVELTPATPMRPNGPLRLETNLTLQSNHHLTLPNRSGIFPHQHQDNFFGPRTSMLGVVTDSPQDSPRTVPLTRKLPKIVIPRESSRSRASSTATSPLRTPPRYRDDSGATTPATTQGSTRPPSLHLPPPSIASPESLPVGDSVGVEDEEAGVKQQHFRGPPVKWWPYSVLPAPGVMISALFPTIYHWREKTWWEKCLGVVAAPSVFLLTVTLPVVENDRDEKEGEGEEDKGRKDLSLESQRSKSLSGAPGQSLAGLKGLEREREDADVDAGPGSHRHGSLGLGLGAAGVAASTEQNTAHNYGEGGRHASFVLDGPPVATPGAISIPEDPMQHQQQQQQQQEQDTPEPWNRWLTIIQLFLAPLLVVFAIYTQSPYDLDTHWIIRTILISLLVSLVLLVPLLLFSTPTHRPQPFRALLSLAGFIVSIAWISTIASQVVGALKALAVILNMSHAIMGLTIFAVGNSLGDLVADVTVARLGYPVMALSACFGGPMLNILLGIGLSGSWILIRGAERRQRKHPGEELRYKSYHIDVSTTLIISGATLLVTLVALLVFVPLNKWVLSRRIGWALIAVWCVSTIGNVVVEVTGVGIWGSE